MSAPLLSVGVPDVSSAEFLTWVRREVLRLQQALIQPTVVTNFRATALAGSIQIDFTRCDGDNYVLYWNTTGSIDGAVRIELGFANKYVDNIGEGGVKRFYAIKAKKGYVEGQVSPWISQTSLSLVTPVNPPAPPVPTDFPFENTETESVDMGYPKGGAVYPL